MPNAYASGKHTQAICDRCGFTYKLKALKNISIKDTLTNIMVCKDCWEPSHPQLQLGKFAISDAQAVRNPRPDIHEAPVPPYNPPTNP